MVTLGTGNYTYEVVENWAKLPDGWGFKEVACGRGRRQRQRLRL